MKNSVKKLITLFFAVIIMMSVLSVCTLAAGGAAPKMPAIASLTNADTGITVKWGAVSGVDGYYLYRKTAGTAWKRVYKATSKTVSYSDKDSSLKSGTTYYYTIRSFKGAAVSSYLKSGTAILRIVSPKIYSAVNVVGGVKVSWGKVGGATGYYIYRKTAGASWKRIGKTTSAAAVSYSDKDASLVSGTTYYYTVKGYNGKTSGSNTSGIKRLYIATPEMISAANTANAISVKWKAVKGAESYIVYKRTDDTSWKAVLKNAPASTLSYTDNYVENDTKYLYTVRAVRNGEKSGYENYFFGVFVETPQLISVKNTASGTTLRWSEIGNTSGYYVYRKSTDSGWRRVSTVYGSYTTSFSDTSVVDDTQYYYTVRAFNGTFCSSYNKTGIMSVFVSAPTLKSAVKTEDGTYFTFGEVEGATKYYIYGRADASSGWAKLGVVTKELFYKDTQSKSKIYTAVAYNGTFHGVSGAGVTAIEGMKISGKSVLTVKQMQSYIRAMNPNVAQSVIDMIPYYISEGEAEGIRGDIAFAQSCIETGNFKTELNDNNEAHFIGSAVTLNQNNFCGLGVTSNGLKGNSFKTPQLGIRAQIQHLKAYANTDSLKNSCIDPRFSLVKRGCSPYVEFLGMKENPWGYGWAGGADYGEKIKNVIERIGKY